MAAVAKEEKVAKVESPRVEKAAKAKRRALLRKPPQQLQLSASECPKADRALGP